MPVIPALGKLRQKGYEFKDHAIGQKKKKR
jgi:hypothetical protein